ncbi:CoA-binding protein [Tenacibaculum aiptasiae]|uniref:CoA-binding protein n=1 Tax=Tenacibaculum aiptasiae TaxID=426481 RepID=A0A7J5AS96_9FLAO|nr:CoA-binding protein [Tenacibaculum aiptasiae]KAB1159813.1 CoA-binding protein [Tenacibaculum aiptasiae]
MDKTTLIIGASLNPNKYSNIALKRLDDKEIKIHAIGAREGRVNEINITTEKTLFDNIDTVTMYLNPKRQEEYYDYVLGLNPRRVIFNPGTENSEFSKILKEKGIKSEIACTLVLLSTNQY